MTVSADQRHTAGDVIDRAQQLFFADERVRARLARLAILAEDLTSDPYNYEATASENELYRELESATDGVISAQEIDSFLSIYAASAALPGDPAATYEIGPFMPWPSVGEPVQRRRGEADATVKLVVAAWLHRLEGASASEADDLAAGDTHTSSAVRKARERLRKHRATLGP